MVQFNSSYTSILTSKQASKQLFTGQQQSSSEHPGDI
jgi:hypothetical protein